MKMKQLHRYTTTLLRTALLFAALAIMCLPTQAQTAGLPDAFETMDPAKIIGDGNYYYIQFYQSGRDKCSYLTDCGVNKIARSKDFLPYANNRLWTLEAAGDGNAAHFKLKNKDGHYLCFGVLENADRVGCVDNSAAASILTFHSIGNDGYYITAYIGGNESKPMYRPSYAEWADLAYNTSYSSGIADVFRLRFAKLKSNAAFIIYYRGEGTDNDNPSSATTRHYLTYSGTAASSLGQNWWSSDVSSRQSIIPANKPLCSLPTAACYHKDGLWTLEKADVEGQFYIKKYGGTANEYLNENNGPEGHSDVYYSEFGSKDAAKGIYTLENPLANRYTRIQNTNYVTEPLTENMFFEWNGYGANASKTSETPSHVDVYFGNNTQLSGGGTVYGDDWHVNYLKYADLTGYRKMTVEGSANMQLRVLMNRVEPIASDQPGYDYDGGGFLEKDITIGSDGKAELDLKNLTLNTTTTGSAAVKMTYVNGSDGTPRTGTGATGNIANAVDDSYGEVSTAYAGYNNVNNGIVGLETKGWDVNYITYMQVDARAIPGTISKVTLKVQVSGSTDNKRNTHWGVGYNNSEWSSSMTWNTADRSITTVGSEVWTSMSSYYSTTFEDKEFDITQAFAGDADRVVTILMYELEPGGGYIKNPTVEVEYYPSVSYAHLNSIKLASSSPSGTITSIKLEKDEHRYLHHADGDGWQVLQWSQADPNNNWWYAGFYPVEVVDEDHFYQAILMKDSKMLGSQAKLKTYNDINPEGWTVEQIDNYQHFKLKNFAGQYYKSNEVLTEDASEAKVFTISELTSEAGIGFYTAQIIPKTETRIFHNVTHKVSNVRLYYTYNSTTAAQQELYSRQGLVTNDLGEWQNADGTQKVNEFKITHYVKKGDIVTYGLPTVLTTNNDHRLYQRWYKYGDDTNLEDLKNHFRLKVDNVEVMSYLYNNGIVTGQRLDWGTIFPGARTYELNYLTYKNNDGGSFTLAADVSRYSDFTYKNSTSHLDGDLEEPSLTMRYIYYMKDAKEMANKLMTCTGSTWYEEKTIHFPATRLAYETKKQTNGANSDAYQGEFIGIKHLFRDYWIFNGNGTGDDNLVSAVTGNNAGYLEFVVEANGTVNGVDYNTGITKGGKDGKGYYLYDEGKKSPSSNYGDSRFVGFKYPDGGTVGATGEDHPAYLKVYFTYNGTRYQVAKFTLIFDENTETLPWTSVDGSGQVKNSTRDPKKLEATAGKPIAKITFDYPSGQTFKNSSAYTIHNIGVMEGLWSEIPNSSPLPLVFDKTNYGFDGDNPSWGSYALVTTMPTRYGNKVTTLPANDATYGYNISHDAGLQSAFLYIDASEQPGEICSVPFTGEFCAEDKLMCSGWISGSNKMIEDDRCPGSVTITVKGELANGEEETIYRFCPGQCYELDNGTGTGGYTGATNVVWQQFYFEFKIDKRYERQWVEVNNNCVSSTGGDFMLDNIEVYALVPEAIPKMNSPICINKDASEMQLLKITLGFDKIISALGATEVTGDTDGVDKTYSFVFLEKDVFLKKFQSELSTQYGINKTIAELESIITTGEYSDKAIVDYLNAYKAAFDAAVLGDPTKIWDSNSPNNNTDAAVLNFHWQTNFSKMESYTFAKAVNKKGAVFRETDSETQERLIVMNGNYPQLSWKVNTDYYIVPYISGVTSLTNNALYEDFNIFSVCNRKREFQIKPPLNILSMDSPDKTTDLEVCEGKIPTLVTELKGYTVNGTEVSLDGLSFDWWLGDLSANPKVIATLDNYHTQKNDAGTVRLDEALGALRVYYPEVTSLDGIAEQLSQTPKLNMEMIYYLQELVNKGQLILHQSSISIPAKKAADDDPYFYAVACPIHDGYFDQALNNGGTTVSYFCDEPQGLRMKVSEKAPTLKCGFVPNENGFATYQYPDGNLTLSIRLAKKAQFETVKHGTKDEAPKEWESNSNLNYLWLPIRDAKVQTTNSTKVIVKSDDYNVYLASTDDPVLDKTISTEMTKMVEVDDEMVWAGSLPIVGKIVQLNAIDVAKNSGETEVANNRLCIYFTENFEVREGYNYALSLPFKEAPGTNTCDGTILINLKIVPDYEVWTGGAGSTDWNNDQNWRRADGNLTTPSQETSDGSGLNNNELLVSASLPNESGLYHYTTNYLNYRTPKDRLLRKGFAPLYCTHILIKSNEWGDDPVLYDALKGKNSLDAAPFPNLSESYDVYSLNTVIDQRFTSIEALSGQSFAIVNETDGKALYGINEQNLGYGSYNMAMQETNTGYYFKIVDGPNGNYLLRLQTPAGADYEFDASWGGHYDGYLNSQPSNTTRPEHCCFILGLNSQYGQDAANHALWEIIPDNNGKFALKNVGTTNANNGTSRYLKDNSWAVYDEPTWFTFCTLKKETVTTTNVQDNILKYDMQARIYDKWNETYGFNPDKGRTGDLIAEMYQINSCDEIAFQPTTELLNAHLLNYNNAWVEYQLDNNRWYLLGSSLRGTISGEWYAPTGTAQQKTTYYEDVKFREGYDRYSPAIYQRSWDKAKAVLYEVGANYSTSDNPNDLQRNNDNSLPGSTLQGQWNESTWNVTGADRYLDRLGYKPLGDKKVNVAIEGIWSNTYNDATVDYSKGAFSVMVKNNLKNNDSSGGTSIIRLPKEDTMYDYYTFEQTGAADGGTDTYLSDTQENNYDDVQGNLSRALNRGRLKSDQLLPISDTSLPLYQKIQREETSASRYGDKRTYTRVPTQVGANALPMTLKSFEETVSAGVSGLGYYLVENPFQSGLDMNKFFAENTGLEKKYWLLTSTGQHLVQQAATGDWITQVGGVFAADKAVLAPGQGFFVEATTPGTSTTISFTYDMQAQTRFGEKSNNGTSFDVVVGTKQKMTTKQETITMDDNSTQTVTVEVPETDGSGNYVLEDITESVTIYNYVQDTGEGKVFPLQSRTTRGEAAESELPGLVITAKRGSDQSSALVMQRSEASNDFLPEEDTETFINSDLKNVPTVYTLCGRLATTINSIHDFVCLPIGVESASNAPCTLTFQGVETLGDSIGFYDAVEQKLTPLQSGMQFTVSGQTQNRYYIVSSLDLKEAAEETHLQIFTEGHTAKVIASTAEPIVSVRCYDVAGQQVHAASPQMAEYSFTLPEAGVYIIDAQTDSDRKTKKVITK